MTGIDFCAGSVVGHDHISVGKTLVGRNNQDAVVVRETDYNFVAVVCDGCGSGAHSEVGAWLAANYIATHVSQRDMLGHSTEDMLGFIRATLLANLSGYLMDLGGPKPTAASINDYLLFTCVGIIVNNGFATIFRIGDGTIGGSINGEAFHKAVGVSANNAPSYLAYELMPSSISGTHELEFKVERFPEWDSLFIGTDGVMDLIAAENKLIPGTQHPVGPITQFWDDDQYYTNKDALNRKLRLCNTDVVRVDPETKRRVQFPRLLPDDTTLVVVRNKINDKAVVDTVLDLDFVDYGNGIRF